MGVTVIRKSRPGDRRYNGKICLVLAGGALTGGAFKVGGLKALNDYLINRKVTDFDMYVGLSAGSLIAGALANNVSPEEMLRSLEGRSHRFTKLHFWDIYLPNYEEFLLRPIQFLYHLLTFFPETFYQSFLQFPRLRQELTTLLPHLLREPNLKNLIEVLREVTEHIVRHSDPPDPLKELIPTAPFDNRRIEIFFRKNVERNNDFNDFVELYHSRGKALYITATNLDTAEQAVFGPDEDSINDVPISLAIQASTAIPGFFRPVRIKGIDYVDGGVPKTANIDVAVERGAQLIIVYNPFRPFIHPDPTLPPSLQVQFRLKRIADQGFFSVMNQVIRTLLHTRLHLDVEQFRKDPYFEGDILLIEPDETDLRFFNYNPLSFWLLIPSAVEGLRSVLRAIEQRFEEIRSVFQVYGIETSRHFVREELKRLRTLEEQERFQELKELLHTEHTRREIRLARGGEE